MGRLTIVFFLIFAFGHEHRSAHAQQVRTGAQLTNARIHNLEPDPRAAVPPHEDPGHNTHQEGVIFGCLGIITVFAVLCTLLLWFVVQRNKSDIRRLDNVIPTIAERMRKELITSNGELMSGTLTASHEFETEFLTNEDVQLTSYRQRREEQQGQELEIGEETTGAEASAPPQETSEEVAAAEAVAAAVENADGNDGDDDAQKTSRRENEENADQIEQIQLVIDNGRRRRRSDRHRNRHSYPQHYHENHSPERRSYERHSPERLPHNRRSYERHLDGYYNDRHHQERHRDHYKEREPRHHERRPEMRYSMPTDTNYINVGAHSKYDAPSKYDATGDVTVETRPPPPAYHAAYDNPGMSLRDERDYRRVPRRNGAPRTAPKPSRDSRPKSAYGFVTSGGEFQEENTRPVSVIGLMDDDADDRWPTMYSFTNGRKYKSLLYESHV